MNLLFLFLLRARLANQLAHSGTSWAQIFSLYHSGTYVNEWMALDFRKFTPGQDPEPQFLTVLEEVPGYIRYEDMTEVLIVSYNILFNHFLKILFNFFCFFFFVFRIRVIGLVITILILMI